ncbi:MULTISPECIES: DUF551 domain-containing protein [unclassified Tatumella]|uniref:DUF551 domain-containing protein n=1 Tax=unclassified Tatumella TaxID=2649542 RepID=UPI001BB05012|nr:MULTISPECIES: DUF551 domain-containing protein [unclassified Tatumella]MBS0878464.1 DUF551 domain-containing protein [Tatumella sp. JGM82]MBS0892040.1 DUF551 domain-containing protein [Tatumella sp. JGM94]MBS0903158.1 DUF551 domain-containing protein [Tatumella sp. JGM100]
MLNPDDIKTGYTLGHADALILRELVEKTRWIPLSERYPRAKVWVLLLDEAGLSIAYKCKRIQMFINQRGDLLYKATHWMPLPEPPA